MAAGRIEPFLRLFFLVLAPTVSWIVAIEIGIMFQDENTFSLTFGQASSPSTLVFSLHCS